MLKLSEAAARDIEILFERSINDFGIGQAEVYYSSLKNCLELLDNNPQMDITKHLDE
jgi:plasmid stabilization system protein ParE